MIGRECKHIKTGHIGKITKEMDGTKDFSDQWGIYWYSGTEGKEHATRIRTIGMLNHWQDKSIIEIL